MRKRIKHPKRPTDVDQLAHQPVKQSTTLESAPVPANLSEYMAAIGRKGGKIGGKRRLKTMTPKERSNIAAKAAKARWNKERK